MAKNILGILLCGLRTCDVFIQKKKIKEKGKVPGSNTLKSDRSSKCLNTDV